MVTYWSKEPIPNLYDILVPRYCLGLSIHVIDTVGFLHLFCCPLGENCKSDHYLYGTNGSESVLKFNKKGYGFVEICSHKK